MRSSATVSFPVVMAFDSMGKRVVTTGTRRTETAAAALAW
jgi:hypothetical protein